MLIASNGGIIAYSKPVDYAYTHSMPLYSDFAIEKIGPNIVTANSSAALEVRSAVLRVGPKLEYARVFLDIRQQDWFSVREQTHLHSLSERNHEIRCQHRFSTAKLLGQTCTHLLKRQ